MRCQVFECLAHLKMKIARDGKVRLTLEFLNQFSIRGRIQRIGWLAAGCSLALNRSDMEQDDDCTRVHRCD